MEMKHMVEKNNEEKMCVWKQDKYTQQKDKSKGNVTH